MADLPTGGTITTDGLYRIHTFTSSGNFVVPYFKPSKTVEILVVAGGGGGGCGGAGGGGAGGLVYHSGKSITAKTYSVTVGNGGASQTNQSFPGNSGQNSVFDDITALGGGGGGSWYSNALTGGSGGGGCLGNSHDIGAGSTQGNSGGGTGFGNMGGNGNAANAWGGGGGGSGGAGGIGGVPIGGLGKTYTISGSSVTYAGGGGGCRGGSSSGQAGGGNGGNYQQAGSSATANTGSGGGGAGDGGQYASGAGGSGIVIIRYLTSDAMPGNTGAFFNFF